MAYLIFPIFVVVLLIVIIGGRLLTDRVARGELLTIRFLDPPYDGLILVGDVVVYASRFPGKGGPPSPTYRMNLISAVNGARVLRKIMPPGPTEYLGQSGSILWFGGKDLLQARDVPQLAVLVDGKDLMRQSPSLSKGIARSRFDPESGTVMVETNDSYRFLINPQSFAAWPEAKPFPEEQRFGVRSLDAVLRNGDVLELRGEARKALFLKAAGEYEPKRQFVCLNPDLTFLDAWLLHGSSTSAPIEIDDPLSVIVTHRDRLDRPGPVFLTRVALAGVPVWSLELPFPPKGAVSVSAARLREDGLLIVAARTKGYSLLLLDPRDGGLLWHAAH